LTDELKDSSCYSLITIHIALAWVFDVFHQEFIFLIFDVFHQEFIFLIFDVSNEGRHIVLV
jgi:deoxyxylulose-5-phosphate synthase